MNSSKFSAGSESFGSREKALISDKSSVINLRSSKYAALIKSEDKSSKHQRSKEHLFRAGGSVISNDTSK